MLKLAIIRIGKKGKTSLAVVRGEYLELSEEDFLARIKDLTAKALPIKGMIFKRRKWKSDEISAAIDKAVAGVSEEFKRKTIRM